MDWPRLDRRFADHSPRGWEHGWEHGILMGLLGVFNGNVAVC